jgi:hypothetical protein
MPRTHEISKADINYFFALLTAGSILGLWILAPFIHMILMPNNVSFKWVNIFTISLVFLVIVFIWEKNASLSPKIIASGRKRNYRVVNILIGFSNITAALVILISMLGYLTNIDFGLVIGVLMFDLILLVVPINIIGIVYIETSRQNKKNLEHL